MLRALVKPASRARHPASLRYSLATVVTLLSLVPNIIVLIVVLLPVYRDQPEAGGRLIGTVVVWLFGVAAVSTVVGYWLSGVLLEPLTRLRDEVVGLGSPGRRAAPASLPVLDLMPAEVEAVRGSFSRLLERLAAEQSKRAAFMATLVHDLKTPVIAANHVLRAIRDDPALGRDERVALVSSLLDENARLLAIVQQMVDAHRFEREGVELELVPTDLAAVVGNVVTRFARIAGERRVRLNWQGSGRVLSSPPELERAISNLVDNALRYAASSVDLRVDGATVVVADDGPGLPRPLDELALPFNAEQVEIAGHRYAAGTGGLGLFIAREIVRAHGGELTQLAAQGTVLRLELQEAP